MKRLLLGVGNRLSRDDGVGPAVARRMVDSDWSVVDCGAAIENAAGIVRRERPDLLVIVDAARMGLPPGSIRLLSVEGSDRMLASTHGLPLSFVLERVRDAARKVLLIGVEPADLCPGEGLTAPIVQAADELVTTLCHGDPERIPRLPQGEV